MRINGRTLEILEVKNTVEDPITVDDVVDAMIVCIDEEVLDVEELDREAKVEVYEGIAAHCTYRAEVLSKEE